MLREAIAIAAASIRLAPALVVAQVEDATTRLLGIEHALAMLGIVEQPASVRTLTGGRSSLVWDVELASGPSVVKRALEAGTVLARGARIAGPQPYPAELSPPARITREVEALRALGAVGVRVPRVIAANPAAAVMQVERLAGVPLSRRLDSSSLVREYRRGLDRVHASGFVLNDAHPGNALVVAGRVALIDLEFAERSTDPARIAFDLAYAAQYLTPAERELFLAGTDVSAIERELAGFAPLFAYEANRLRAA